MFVMIGSGKRGKVLRQKLCRKVFHAMGRFSTKVVNRKKRAPSPCIKDRARKRKRVIHKRWKTTVWGRKGCGERVKTVESNGKKACKCVLSGGKRKRQGKRGGENAFNRFLNRFFPFFQQGYPPSSRALSLRVAAYVLFCANFAAIKVKRAVARTDLVLKGKEWV